MVDDFINEVIDIDYIISRPIEGFTTKELCGLAEKAKKNDLLLTLRSEHSNLHQGILVSLVRKDVADKFIKYL